MIAVQSRYPWEEDPYDLISHKDTDILVKDEHGVVTVDFKKRNWREKI
ncbi:hypothetical protein [Methanolobus halotolerans]|nr:hypothetical protein [Methanolobus halotolerans]